MHFTVLVTGSLRSTKTQFSRKVEELAEEIMEPYSQYTDDPYQLIFEDHTQRLMDKFQNGCMDCIKFPNGRVVAVGEYPYYRKYAVHNGKVYERAAGYLHHMKRTKSAKRMKALPAYPISKIYKSFSEYAEEYCGYEFDKEHNGYGIYINPNTRHNGYAVGGLWEELFLVSTDCKEYSIGESLRWPTPQKRSVPDGYMWVCAARKKDIAWEIMREWAKNELTELYGKLKTMFEQGYMEPDYFGDITEDGIMRFDKCIFQKHESLDSFLGRYGYSDEYRYLIPISDIADEEQWISSEDYWADPVSGEVQELVQWQNRMEEYIDSLSEDTVLIGVDCHL